MARRECDGPRPIRHVLDGDMDTLVPMEEVRRVGALFPGSTFVSVAEAGHVTIGWTQCSANLQSQFFETCKSETPVAPRLPKQCGRRWGDSR